MADVSKVSGVKELVAAFKTEGASKAKGLEQGLKLAGLHLFNTSQDLVPVWRGILRGSGRVRSVGGGFKAEVIVSYGTDYAIYVHENLQAAHGTKFNQKNAEEISDPPKWVNLWGEKVKGSMYYFSRGVRQQAKFLEQPLRTEQKTMQKIIRTAIKLIGK